MCLPAFRKVFPRENSNTWTPDYWISFLLIGLPAGDDGRTVLGAGIYYLYSSITFVDYVF